MMVIRKSKNVVTKQLRQPSTFYVTESCRVTEQRLQCPLPVEDPVDSPVYDVADDTTVREFPAAVPQVAKHDLEAIPEAPPPYSVSVGKEELPPPYTLLSPSALIISEVGICNPFFLY